MVDILCVLSILNQAYNGKVLLLWGKVKVLKAPKVWGKPACAHKQGKIHMAFCWLGKTRGKMPSTGNLRFRKWERSSHGKNKKNQDKRTLDFSIRVRGGEARRKPWELHFRKKQALVSRAMTASCFHSEVWVELTCCGWKILREQRAVSWTLDSSVGWRDKWESRRATKARTIDWNNFPPPRFQVCHENGNGGGVC